MVMALVNQCSPQVGKSVLRIFFDGVPEADSASLAGNELVDQGPDTGIDSTDVIASQDREVFVHYPYGEQECSSCHDELSIGNMVEPEPGLCYTCHENLGETYSYLHGPVAGGYCTACHDPHRSKNEHLLKLTGAALCFYCHMEESVRRNEMHRDLEGMQCMDCHNPHGGDDKYIFQ
jgi:predicted CXXCH cytochrome family protein